MKSFSSSFRFCLTFSSFILVRLTALPFLFSLSFDCSNLQSSFHVILILPFPIESIWNFPSIPWDCLVLGVRIICFLKDVFAIFFFPLLSGGAGVLRHAYLQRSTKFVPSIIVVFFSTIHALVSLFFSFIFLHWEVGFIVSDIFFIVFFIRFY